MSDADYYRDMARAYQASESALRRRVESMRKALKVMADAWTWDDEYLRWYVHLDEYDSPEDILATDDAAVDAPFAPFAPCDSASAGDDDDEAAEMESDS